VYAFQPGRRDLNFLTHPAVFRLLDDFWCGSVHAILANTNPITIDVYRGRNSINTSKSFQERYGKIMTMILQSGYNPKNIVIKKDPVVVKKRQVKDLTNKLVF